MSDKAIGPTFFSELRAAGLAGLPFSWGADGSLHFDVSMTADQIAGVKTVYAGHDPTKQDYTSAALAALTKSDVTMMRCAENGVPVPPLWASYRAMLRAIMSGKQAGPLPPMPAFPAGT